MPDRSQSAPAIPLLIDLGDCFATDDGSDVHLLPDRCFRESLPSSQPPTLQDTQLLALTPVVVSPPVIGIGMVLDKYRIEVELGAGGFAVVYRARHLLLRTPVAIKLLRPGRDGEADLEALCEEARFAAMVAHPNVVRVFDVVRSASMAYIVMEFVDGLSLAELIREQGPVDPLTVIEIALGACDGLAAALACGLIHRDVKPGNLLLRHDRQVLLADFGLARSGTEAVSASAGIVGTPAYLAPELAVDPSGIDHRSDMYALGATLFHALTGHQPYEEPDILRMIACHLHQPVPDPRRWVADLPDELADLVMTLMAKERRERPADYRDLRQLLGQVRDSLTVSHRRPRQQIIHRLRSWFQ